MGTCCSSPAAETRPAKQRDTSAVREKRATPPPRQSRPEEAVPPEGPVTQTAAADEANSADGKSMTIVLRLPSGRTDHIVVSDSSTTGQLKHAIQRNGGPLPDEMRLLRIVSDPPFDLRVTDMLGNEIMISDVRTRHTVAELKLKVQAQNGIEPDAQRLILQRLILGGVLGKTPTSAATQVELQNHAWRLLDYGLTPGSTVLLATQDIGLAQARQSERSDAKEEQTRPVPSLAWETLDQHYEADETYDLVNALDDERYSLMALGVMDGCNLCMVPQDAAVGKARREAAARERTMREAEVMKLAAHKLSGTGIEIVALESCKPPSEPGESERTQLLFHGTKADCVGSILKNGMAVPARSVYSGGTSGTALFGHQYGALGDAIYFSTSPRTAVWFGGPSGRDGDVVKFDRMTVLCCEVETGKELVLSDATQYPGDHQELDPFGSIQNVQLVEKGFPGWAVLPTCGGKLARSQWDSVRVPPSEACPHSLLDDEVAIYEPRQIRVTHVLTVDATQAHETRSRFADIFGQRAKLWDWFGYSWLWGTMASFEGGDSPATVENSAVPALRRKYQAGQIALDKVYETARPFAEAWAMGAWARRGGGNGAAPPEDKTEEELAEIVKKHKEHDEEYGRVSHTSKAGVFAAKKQKAMDEGQWHPQWQRKKKKPSKAAAPVDFTKFAEAAAKSQTPEQKKAVEKAQKARAEAVEAVKAAAVAAGKSPAEAEAAAAAAVPPPKIVTPATLGAALGAGQAAAAEAAPTTENPEHLKMRTKDFLSRSLMADLQKALARMQEDRPTDVQAYLAAVLNGEEPPKVHVKDEEGSSYTYLKNNAIFGLLRPALLCCDRDRPKDPKKYIAAFVAGAVDSL